MKIFYLGFAMLLLLAACKEGWTDDYKKEYLQSCNNEVASSFNNEGQSKNYCQCSLETMMRHYESIEEVIINKDSSVVKNELEKCREEALKQ